MYKLYWIKYPNYTNPNTEGYIGMTSQSLEKRFTDHKSNKKINYWPIDVRKKMLILCVCMKI